MQSTIQQLRDDPGSPTDAAQPAAATPPPRPPPKGAVQPVLAPATADDDPGDVSPGAPAVSILESAHAD
eukprot:COSAG02_NODE_37399_length_442_cov_1.055394_1_plen_69_part_00